jgi:hypothetical protein
MSCEPPRRDHAPRRINARAGPIRREQIPGERKMPAMAIRDRRNQPAEFSTKDNCVFSHGW